MKVRVLAELAEVGVEDDFVAVMLPILLIDAGHGAAKKGLDGGVRGGSGAKPYRGIAEKRSRLRHHHLSGAVVRDALVLDVAQIPL